jgi:CubicO group peptidase (beta-lactamase class C family)
MLRNALIVVGVASLCACAAAVYADTARITRYSSGCVDFAESTVLNWSSDLSLVRDPKTPELGSKMGSPDDLAPTLQALAEKFSLPGAVGAILHGDKIVALGSTGVRKVGNSIPFLVTDTIHLGSDTKAMTALLIGQLIDRKQLAFETTMAEIFPNLAPRMNPLMARNTVRNLLDQVAGFPHDLDSWWALDASGLSLGDQRHKAVERCRPRRRRPSEAFSTLMSASSCLARSLRRRLGNRGKKRCSEKFLVRFR